MKKLKLIFVVGVLAMVGCSGGSGTASSGGSSGSSGGTTGSSGGSTGTGGHGSGGNSASGGAVGTGGHASGGSTASGGATGSGGTASGGAIATGGGTGTGGKGTGGTASGGAASGGTPSGGATAGGGQSGSGNTGGRVATGGTSGGGASGSAGSSGTSHWVGTWTASPYYDTNTANAPPVSLSNTVIRQIAHVSLGGSQLRVQFSNLQSNASLEIKAAHVALCKATPAVDSTIDMSTDKALAFSGMASVTLAAGKEVWSDPIDFALPALGNLTITTAFGSVPSMVTSHSGSRTTSYIKSGTDVTPASLTGTGVTTVEHWYAISGIDVMADAAARGIVAIGDSITDGRGTDTDHNNRWTDVLASRLQMNAGTMNVSMMNQGIGGSLLIGSAPAAQARYARDVLGQSGVKYVIVLDGVNDIHGGASLDSLKSAYMSLISMAHAKNLLIYGGTITPFGGDADYASGDSLRVQVNTFIKSGVFDGVIDFDAALTDGGNPAKLQAMYSTWSQADGLHPGPAGYQKMGETPDLTLFTK